MRFLRESFIKELDTSLAQSSPIVKREGSGPVAMRFIVAKDP